jgi:asparagine synthase (glutamine-hydrolysing)
MQSEVLEPAFLASLNGFDVDAPLVEAWRHAPSAHQVDTMLNVDVHTYLPDDLLVKMDIATMAHSVEARSPFLDHHLMQLAASIPAREKLRGTSGKRILKAALRGILPDQILDRPKMGFGVPLPRWFREDLRTLPSDVLLDPSSSSQRYVTREATMKMIRQHQAGEADHSLRLWVLLQLEYWHREVVQAPLLANHDRTDSTAHRGQPNSLPSR